MDYVIVDDVYKSYRRRYGAPTLRLQQAAGRPKEVDEALKGCSLQVAGGEVLSVLGARNSGRSTLMSVIAGVYRPDKGMARVRGRATGLVAMGVGFSGVLPVHACISLNAALLGMSKEHLAASMDAILAFAGLPHASLSYPLREIAGSRRRQLAYAIAIHAKPEVFLADGLVVLGKDELAERCFVELEALRDAGHALVLASNNKGVARRLSERAVVLDDGRVVFDGPVGPALKTLRRIKRQ
jgi:ABC-type polysaccharide/polyol phosphate transport system ATPase subunit